MIYTIIAYKENNDDTCRGCVRARYGSDLQFKSFEEAQKAADYYAEMSLIVRDEYENSYTLYILYDGKEYPDEYEIQDVFEGMCHTSVENLKAKQAEEKKKAEQIELERKILLEKELEDAKTAKEKQEYNRLKLLYEPHRVD